MEEPPEKSSADPTGHTPRPGTFELETLAVEHASSSRNAQLPSDGKILPGRRDSRL